MMSAQKKDVDNLQKRVGNLNYGLQHIVRKLTTKKDELVEAKSGTNIRRNQRI
jgi:hypothetical protein